MHEFKRIQKYFRASSDRLGMFLGVLGSTVRNAIAGRSYQPSVRSHSYWRLVAAVSHEAATEEVYQPVPEEVKDLQKEATRRLAELNFQLKKADRARTLLLEKRRVAYTGYTACPPLLADPQNFTQHEQEWLDLQHQILGDYLRNQSPLSQLHQLDAKLRALEAEKAHWQEVLLAHTLPTAVPNLNPTYTDLRADREASPVPTPARPAPVKEQA